MRWQGCLQNIRINSFSNCSLLLFGSVILSFLIARLVAMPIHLAFHDSLTGLKNRAAFEDEITKRLERKNSRISFNDD